MNAPLRMVFMGTPDFAVPSLEALMNGPDRVVAVVCQPDRERGRGKKLSPPAVKVAALRHDLPVLQPASVRTEAFLAQMRTLAPDLLVVAAYGKILPAALLQIPPMGAINVHGSLLPRYRGAAPIQWAVINGETETGITIMRMDEGLDTGDILLTASEPIGLEDTSGSLFTRLALLGGTTLVKAVALLKEGKLQPTPQDPALATLAPMLTKEQGHLDWRLPATALHNCIRGLDPWPSAFSFLDGKRLLLFSPTVVRKQFPEPPGIILRANGEGLLVAAGADALLLRDIQPEGRKRMDVATWLRGTRFPAGARFS